MYGKRWNLVFYRRTPKSTVMICHSKILHGCLRVPKHALVVQYGRYSKSILTILHSDRSVPFAPRSLEIPYNAGRKRTS